MPKRKETMSLKKIAFEEIFRKLRKFGNYDQCSSNIHFLRKFIPNTL